MPTMAHQAKWAFKASSGDPSTASFATGAVRWAVVSDSVKAVRPVVEGAGIIGHRGHVTERSRVTQESYSGTLTFELSMAILQWFIGYMLGDASTPHEPTDTLGDMFDFLRDDGATVYWYKNCQVEAWRVKGSSGGLVMLELDIQAKDEVVTGETGAQAFPDIDLLATDISYEPLIAAECTISIDSTDRDCDDFELGLNHVVEVKHRHSIKPSDFLPGRRETTFKTNTVWTSTEKGAFYRADEDGLAATLTITRDSIEAIFTMTKVVFDDNAPNVSGAGELLYGIDGKVKGNLPIDTSGVELSVTVDSTV